MKRTITLVCLVFGLISGASVNGQQPGGATLKVFAKEQGTVNLSRAVGMVGFYGQHQPQMWRILVMDPVSPAHLREYLMQGGHVVGERRFERTSDQDYPSIPLRMETIKVDSDRAFVIADAAARQAGVGFDGIHYQLRCRDLRNEPIWMMNLIDQMQRPVGTVYVSAQSGETIRKVWNQVGNPSYSQGSSVPVASSSTPAGSGAVTQSQSATRPSSQVQGGIVEPPVPQVDSFGGKVKNVWRKILPDRWVDESSGTVATGPVR
ncbi:MAG: hypothetical protein R3F31_17720 [Verrucomicrobiales bacterium]